MAKKGKDDEQEVEIPRYVENTNLIFLKIMSIPLYNISLFLIAATF